MFRLTDTTIQNMEWKLLSTSGFPVFDKKLRFQVGFFKFSGPNPVLKNIVYIYIYIYTEAELGYLYLRLYWVQNETEFCKITPTKTG